MCGYTDGENSLQCGENYDAGWRNPFTEHSFLKFHLRTITETLFMQRINKTEKCYFNQYHIHSDVTFLSSLFIFTFFH